MNYKKIKDINNKDVSVNDKILYGNAKGELKIGRVLFLYEKNNSVKVIGFGKSREAIIKRPEEQIYILAKKYYDENLWLKKLKYDEKIKIKRERKIDFHLKDKNIFCVDIKVKKITKDDLIVYSVTRGKIQFGRVLKILSNDKIEVLGKNNKKKSVVKNTFFMSYVLKKRYYKNFIK